MDPQVVHRCAPFPAVTVEEAIGDLVGAVSLEISLLCLTRIYDAQPPFDWSVALRSLKHRSSHFLGLVQEESTPFCASNHRGQTGEPEAKARAWNSELRRACVGITAARIPRSS
jgi:hypothetical protein